MTIVGFTFTKIGIERKSKIPEKVEVKSKIHLKNIVKQDIKIAEGKGVLRFDFHYNIEYSPELANIDFQGHLLGVFDPKEVEEIQKLWKKNKKIDSKLKLTVYNAIFHKCNVKAFELEEDFNLPLHLKLPTIRAEEK